MKQIPWFAFYSQTGSEIVNICKTLEIKPEVVITNNPKKTAYENYEFFRDNSITIIYLPFNPVLNDYIKIFYITSHVRNCIISLNGWMRVIPPEMCSSWYGKIWNGHPGLITRYPELKGLNKQNDVYLYKDKYPVCGSVIHEVTEYLDAGKVCIEVSTKNISNSIDDSFLLLKQTSLESWIIFFSEYDNIQNCKPCKWQNIYREMPGFIRREI